jgi:hypothetical protein
MEPYARLSSAICVNPCTAPPLRRPLKRADAYCPVPHLDPALRACLQSALQRSDLTELLGICFWREGLEAAFGAEGGERGVISWLAGARVLCHK